MDMPFASFVRCLPEKQNNNLLVQPDTKLKIQYYQFRIFLLTNSKLCRSKDLIVTSFPEAKEEKPRSQGAAS